MIMSEHHDEEDNDDDADDIDDGDGDGDGDDDAADGDVDECMADKRVDTHGNKMMFLEVRLAVLYQAQIRREFFSLSCPCEGRDPCHRLTYVNLTSSNLHHVCACSAR